MIVSPKTKLILDWLKNRKFLVFTVIILLLSYIIILPFLPVIAWLEQIKLFENPTVKEDNLIFEIIAICLLIPIVEIWLFQYLPVVLLSRVCGNKLIQIALSALLFGISHFYNLGYIVMTTLMGVVFAFSFIIYKDSHGKRSAYWSVTLAYGMRNAIAVFFILFE